MWSNVNSFSTHQLLLRGSEKLTKKGRLVAKGFKFVIQQHVLEYLGICMQKKKMKITDVNDSRRALLFLNG